MKRIALFPGSFDPITKDMRIFIESFAAFDEINIAIGKVHVFSHQP